MQEPTLTEHEQLVPLPLQADLMETFGINIRNKPMPVYVRSGGTWRETSELYVRDATSYTNKTILNGYIKQSGTWEEFYTLFNTPAGFTTAGSGTTNDTVPTNANAIQIQAAVGGGGGNRGQDYDNIGLEQGGPGGGSGAYISDVVFSVTGGEQLTFVVGALGPRRIKCIYWRWTSSRG